MIEDFKQLYFNDMKRIGRKQITSELLAMVKEGKLDAKQEFIEACQGIIVNRAKRLMHVITDTDMELFFDLIQEGNVVLCQCVYEKPNSIPDTRTAPYIASTVWHKMISFLYKRLPLSVCRNIRAELNKYKKSKDRLLVENGPMTVEEVAKKLNMPILRALFLEKVDYQQKIINLDNPISIENDTAVFLKDVIADDNAQSPMEEAGIKWGMDMVMKALPEAGLTKIESKVLALTYGLFGEPELTYGEIQRELVLKGLSNTRAIKKIREAMHYKYEDD